MQTDFLDEVRDELREFVEARDWAQFQSPKNLAMALMVEAGELAEHFQWMTEAQSRQLEPEKEKEVAHEIADVFVYLVRIADQLGIDLKHSVREKIALNAQKYPVELVRGSAKKYTEY